MAGTKDDEGKPRIELVPPSLIMAVAEVLSTGAITYGERNWEKGLAWSRVYGALQRHLQAFWSGEDLDPETHKPHLWHAACELAFLIEFLKTKPLFDDRPHTWEQ